MDDLSPYLSAEDRARFRDELLTARNEGLFTPPSFRGTVEMPGNNGGANWGGAAVDGARGKLFIVSKDLPCLLKLEPDKTAAGAPDKTRYVSGFGFMIASNGLSPIAPPWTTMTAYDLNEGVIRWRIPLGDVPDLGEAKNTGAHFPKVGPVVTAGGLIFTGTRDRKVRAFDVETGKMLWEAAVEFGVEGIPAVYQVGGREFIVFCVAAQPGITKGSQVKIAGKYVAFALEGNGK